MGDAAVALTTAPSSRARTARAVLVDEPPVGSLARGQDVRPPILESLLEPRLRAIELNARPTGGFGSAAREAVTQRLQLPPERRREGGRPDLPSALDEEGVR